MVTRSAVKWRCRRGMRELDILLAGFLEKGFDALDDDALTRLDAMLAAPDQDILAWLSGAHPPPPEHADIVRRIRATLP